jgi:hypothetical protein
MAGATGNMVAELVVMPALPAEIGHAMIDG